MGRAEKRGEGVTGCGHLKQKQKSGISSTGARQRYCPQQLLDLAAWTSSTEARECHLLARAPPPASGRLLGWPCLREHHLWPVWVSHWYPTASMGGWQMGLQFCTLPTSHCTNPGGSVREVRREKRERQGYPKPQAGRQFPMSTGRLKISICLQESCTAKPGPQRLPHRRPWQCLLSPDVPRCPPVVPLLGFIGAMRTAAEVTLDLVSTVGLSSAVSHRAGLLSSCFLLRWLLCND